MSSFPYCEAFVGGRPSVALFHHLFNLRFTAEGQRSACVSFVDLIGARTHLKAGKKVEVHRHHWVFMDARRESLLLATPLGPPKETSRWSHKKLTDPRVGPVLERIASLAEAKLMGAMIIKEFMGHRIVPLHARSCPLWVFADDRDPMRLHVSAVMYDELDVALGLLLGPSPKDLPQAMPLLYASDDMERMIAEMPSFNEWRLVRPHKGSPITMSS
ncbi:hypothetical protein D1007_18440 [Hordeum vulgare]|nr:hypothetical protein D1007_18440 [Hordeum vulgare]